MKIYLSPQVSEDNEKIHYSFDEDIIIARYMGQRDTFNFSSMPNGVAEDIATTLSLNPIISAKRENGELWVELFNLIGLDATEEEKFPEWIDYKGYNKTTPPKEVKSDG